MKPLKLCVIADTHYYDASLGISGEAYRLRSASDQKCLAETDAIISAAFKKIADSDCDAVLLAGDLTNDGERICHEKMREKLYGLQKHKRVFVTTATHDWCCDRNPRRFAGDEVYNDVETVSHEELYALYDDFGTAAARDKFITHLGTASYLVDLSDDVVLLALNDDQNGKGKAGYKPDHLQWILDTVRRESAAGKTVIGMQHHLLYPHLSPLVTDGCCCGDREELLEQLCDAGLRLMLVGHSHIQRIDRYTSPAGNELVEINVGSLCGYPAPMVQIEITAEDIRIHTEFLEQFSYNGKTVEAQGYLRAHAVHLLGGVLDTLAFGDRRAMAKKLASFGIADAQTLAENYGGLLQFGARKVLTCTVGKVYKAVRLLPIQTDFDANDVRALQNVPLTDIANDLLLAALSGVPAGAHRSSAYANILRAAGSLPEQICKAMHLRNTKLCTLCAELRTLMTALCTGGEADNHTLTISRKQL